MSDRERSLVIRRILVALDASPHSIAALEAAAELAAHFQAELAGLFVQDVNLLRLAELPFAREVGFFSATRRRLDSRGLERQLRVRARQMRRRLTGLAEETRLQWSFQVARGAIASELLAAAAEADMIILGKAGWSFRRPKRLGSTARAMASQAPGLTLILQQGACLGTPVLVVYDGSDLARKALRTLVSLIEPEEEALNVLLLADGADNVDHLQREASHILAEHEVEVRYRSLTKTNVPKLSDLVQIEGCGTLVLPAKSVLLKEKALLALLDELEVPVLLVR